MNQKTKRNIMNPSLKMNLLLRKKEKVRVKEKKIDQNIYDMIK